MADFHLASFLVGAVTAWAVVVATWLLIVLSRHVGERTPEAKP